MAKKNYVYGGKGVAVMEWLNKDPNASDAHIAKYVQCHPTYVKQIRKKMIHAQQRETPLYDTFEELMTELKSGPEIDDILTERNNRYGNFIDGAEIIRAFKHEIYTRGAYGRLAADQAEALDMIFHKIGRIATGDPNYVDSWTDIAGYAKLVADRLQGVVR